MNLAGEKVIHIGPLPPPLGGISVYLYRLSKQHPEWFFWNERDMNKIAWLKLLFTRKTLYVYHSPSLKKRLFLFFLSVFTSNSYVWVVHGESLRDDYSYSGWFVHKLLVMGLKHARYIQVVNSGIREFIRGDLGLKSVDVVVRNAFLPPPLEDEENILATYDACLLNFTNAKRPLIVANASSLVFYQGKDLYGLDMCVELVARLKKKYRDIGLLFALAKVGNKEYFRKIKARISELGIENNIYFMTGQKELWPLFKKADLMVRPTYNDGYGISIAEALYFDCPAIASDVCDRPEGTILFRNRDIDDLCEKSLRVLRARKVGKKIDKEM